MSISCPLCLNQNHREIENQLSFKLYQCFECFLIYKDPLHFLDLQEEKSRYENHENTEESEGYIKFLNRLRLPLLPFLKNKKMGLEFGCGPGPVLKDLFEQDGFQMQVYDPFFYPDIPKKQFDFITSTEVIEHFHKPNKSFEQINSLLLPQGILALMTYTYSDPGLIENWWYLNDPTHVSFYHQKTFEYLSEHFSWLILKNNSNLAFFQKGP